MKYRLRARGSVQALVAPNLECYDECVRPNLAISPVARDPTGTQGPAIMTTTHAVGIDLGTTYSCIAYLNEHGEPVTLGNEEGELSTPSVVLFDGGEIIVGTEALRNAIARPKNVVQNSKRFIGDPATR